MPELRVSTSLDNFCKKLDLCQPRLAIRCVTRTNPPGTLKPNSTRIHIQSIRTLEAAKPGEQKFAAESKMPIPDESSSAPSESFHGIMGSATCEPSGTRLVYLSKEMERSWHRQFP